MIGIHALCVGFECFQTFREIKDLIHGVGRADKPVPDFRHVSNIKPIKLHPPLAEMAAVHLFNNVTIINEASEVQKYSF